MTNHERLWVTIDARALDGALMGTQILVLELTRALARTEALRLRVLIYAERIDRETLESLRELPETEILAVEDVDETTPPSALFHRPQQAFSQADIALAWQLGERVVLSQLDLIAYRNRAYFANTDAWEDYRRASRHGMIAAERVLVLSEHTRRELLDEGLVEAERIAVIPPGLDHRTQGQPHRPPRLSARAEEEGEGANEQGENAHEQDEAAHELGFLLCLGTDYHHKNRVFALRLLAALRERHGWSGRLILAGTHVRYGSSREAEREELDAHPELRAAVVDLGAVGEGGKEWLMRHADAVLYPSTYEGFGLVPCEAALHGVPCLFAATTSLAEGAIGEAATIVPGDPTRSADVAAKLLHDPRARAQQVELLAGAARELTWDRAAVATVDAYREAAEAPVREAAMISRDMVARERELTAAHAETVQTLIDERELVLSDYNELVEVVGPARSLIGPEGALPEDLQRGLLALSARPALSGPLFSGLARLYAALRAVGRALRAPLRRER
ncbi:MAG TPA: glycosyltransferase [Solirubrobacteraceae bacterium]|jgi:glycosyltransferase involved in cell wall biosynthesis